MVNFIDIFNERIDSEPLKGVGPGIEPKVRMELQSSFGIGSEEFSKLLNLRKMKNHDPSIISNQSLEDRLNSINYKIKNLDSILYDCSTFMPDNIVKILDGLKGKASVDGKDIEFKSANESGYKYVLDINNGEEQWFISEANWFHDQFPSGYLGGPIILWNSDNKNVMSQSVRLGADITRSETNVEEFIKRLYIQSRVALQDRSSELNDEANISSFDIPKSEEVGYIGLIPNGNIDPIISAGTDDIRYFPDFMNSLGYNFVGLDGKNNLLEGGNIDSLEKTLESLIETIEKFKEKGVNTLYLNIFGHGSHRGIQLSGYSVSINYSILKELFNRFPEMNFIVNIYSCYGGGIENKLDGISTDTNDYGREGRITVFVDSKIDSLSTEGRLKNGYDIPLPDTSYYKLFLYKALSEGKSYGEAHQFADEKTKLYSGNNPEVFSNSKKKWKKTADNGVGNGNMLG